MPRRLLDAATIEQVLVRDLFGERIAKLTVDTEAAYEAGPSNRSYAVLPSYTLHRSVLCTGMQLGGGLK